MPPCLSSLGGRTSKDKGLLEVLCASLSVLCTLVWVNSLVLTEPENDSSLVAAQIFHPTLVFIEMQGQTCWIMGLLTEPQAANLSRFAFISL